MNPRAVKATYKKPYYLLVSFTNGEEKVFDFQTYLKYPVYEKLADEAFCNKVKVKDGIVVWAEEIDIDPDRLYLESKLVSKTVI